MMPLLIGYLLLDMCQLLIPFTIQKLVLKPVPYFLNSMRELNEQGKNIKDFKMYDNQLKITEKTPKSGLKI